MLKYTIICAEKAEDNGGFIKATIVGVYAKTEREAISKAKKLIKRKIYYIRDIQEEIIQEAQENAIEKMMKVIKSLK